MTWKELKERIERMPEDVQNEEVLVWGEDIPPTECLINKTLEDMYIHDDFDNICYPLSELEDYKPEDCTLVKPKGKYYICVE